MPFADKDFVNSSIENVAAYYITKNAAGDPFATKAELDAATVYYSGGVVRVPTRNDYCVVLADETKVIPATSEHPTTRYIYGNNTWSYQYIVNNTGLTAAQWAAVNSNITSTKVSGYDSHLANGDIHVTTTNKAVWNAKQDTLTFDSTPTSGSTNPVTSGGIKTALDGKQDTLTFDSTPTSGSTNPVTSGGIHEYVNEKCAWGQITGVLSNQTDLNSALSGKESKAVFIQASIVSTASMWSGKTYNGFVGGSFASCDIEVSISPSATDTQRDAYASAMFTGSALDNTLTALGDKPSVDIPVYIRKWSV